MVDSKYMTFLPGEEPGPYALGLTDHTAALDRLAAYKLRMSRIPTGSRVSREFPWLRNVRETLLAGEKAIIRRNINYQTTFQNTSDHPVKVQEIRFYADYDTSTVPTWQTALEARIDIPDQKVINAEFLPVNTLSTEIDRYLVAARKDSHCFELPTPYLLQRANTFVVDVLYSTLFAIAGDVGVRDWVLMLGLHGWGLVDGEPISLMKPVRAWDFQNAVAGQYQTVVFDDEQQRPMRDAIITHITVGRGPVCPTAPQIRGLEIRPVPPEGPSWHTGEFFHLYDLSEQVDVGTTGNCCIHRPVLPYTLERGEGIRIELWNNSAVTVNISSTLRGVQEGIQ